MSKVRIYDLAKELKLESKKILEDARRMGVDVSVPSNTLEDNIAAKIREMYYPKKEQAAAPGAEPKSKVIKLAPPPSAEPALAPKVEVEQAAPPASPAHVQVDEEPVHGPALEPRSRRGRNLAGLNRNADVMGAIKRSIFCRRALSSARSTSRLKPSAPRGAISSATRARGTNFRKAMRRG